MLVGRKKYTNSFTLKSNLCLGLMDNRKTLYIASVIFFLWTVFSIVCLERFYEEVVKVSFCKMDGFVLMDNITVKGLVLFPVVIHLYTSLFDKTSIQYLIRKIKRTELFKSDSKKIVFIAVYFLVFQLICIISTTNKVCLDKENWTQIYTVFWYETGKILSDNPNYLVLVSMFMINNFLEYCLLGLSSLWGSYCNKKYLAYLLGITVTVLRVVLRDYIGKEGIWFSQWIEWNSFSLLCKGIVIVGLYVICNRIIYRKDFYCDQ